MADNKPGPLVSPTLDSLSNPTFNTLVPRGTLVPEESPSGSTFMANLKDSTIWGGLLNGRSSRVFDPEALRDFDFIDHIPNDMLEHADRFALDNSVEQIDNTSNIIRRELEDDAILAAHPVTSFITGIGAQILDPVNLLPGAAIYKNVMRGSRVMKSVVGSSITALASTTVQESILQNRQLTREAEESVVNVLASGILAGALGGAATGVAARFRMNSIQRGRALKQISNELTDTEVPAGKDGFMTDAQIEGLPTGFRPLMNFSPMNRLFNSTFKIARIFSDTMYEHNYNLIKNATGETSGNSVETLIKTSKRKISASMLDYQDIYFAMNGIKGGPFKGTRDKISKQVMNFEEFDAAVSLVLTTDEVHANKSVNQGAQLLRDRVFDPLKNDAIKLGMFPEDISVKNAANYFMIAYNRQLITEQGGRSARGPGTFPQALFDGFKDVQTRTEAFKKTEIFREITSNIERAAEKRKLLKAEKTILGTKSKLAKQATAARKSKTKQSIKKLAEIKEKIARLESLNEQVKQFDADLKAAKEQLKNSVDDDMLNSKGELRKPVSDDVLWSNAEQTVDTVLGNQEGTLFNPLLERIRSAKGKPLKERTLILDQVGLRPWQVTSASRISELYTRAMVPSVELARVANKFGFDNIDTLKVELGNRLKKEFDAQNKGLTGKKATKFEKKFEETKGDMQATFELLEGVYGSGPNVLDNSAQRFHRNFLKWNAIRLLGFMTLSSLADVGIQVFRHGPFKVIFDGLVPALKGFSKNTLSDLRAIGYGIEGDLGTKVKSFAEHEGLTTEAGPFTRFSNSMVDAFGNLTLMNQWNSWQQKIAGNVGINRTLNTIHAIKNGEKVSVKDRKRLAQLGIKEEHFDIIFEKTKGMIDEPTNTRYASWDTWKVNGDLEASALREFQASVAKEIDSIVIIPGLGDKPLFGHTNFGKSLLQFKTFLLAATNKILFSGIQRRTDIDVYTGVSSMLAFGALSYVTTALVRGDEPDLSFENLSKEAIDRSGVLGIFMEVFNIGQKNGLIPGAPVSKYRSRSLLGSLLGPSGGLIDELGAVLGKLTGVIEGEGMSTKDAQKMLRLVPYQNLFYLQQINKAITNKAALNLGLRDAG